MNDSELIDRLGGPSALAEKLGMDNRGRARVCNWRKRGIPARVKLAHPDLFLVEPAAPCAANTEIRDAV